MHDHNDDVDPELLIQFKQLWNEADELWDRERDNPSFHGYVSSDYMMAYEWLLKLRDRVCTIVEWGSGLGIVAIMASRLGYEAYGIESESELVDYSRDFAKSFGPDAQFAVGSFIPDAFQLDMAAGEEIVRTDVDAPAAYDDFDMELRDFDLIYAYPWPDERAMFESIVRQFGQDGAMMLSFDVREGMDLIVFNER
ncbi:MAG: hypothetical protein KDB27_35665 [Planctomycetales bacterium]|nr:hypothetical protein [Planctomycetales bacterium]